MAFKLAIVSAFLVQAISGHHTVSLGGGNAGARFTVGSGLSGAGSLSGISGGLNRGAYGGGVTGGLAGSNMDSNLLNNYGSVNDFILGNGEDITFGGTFGVSSLSSYSPTGLFVVSDNVLEGPVAVSGQLPFLGTVALGGSVPSGGFAGVSYGSGYSDVGILQQVGAGVCPCGRN